MTNNKAFGKLYIKKRTLPCWLACYIAVFPLFMATLIDFFHLPDIVKYTADVAWVLALLALIFLRKHFVFEKKVTPFIIYVIGFFLLLFIVYLFNYQSTAYFLWGFRNNFRFYIAFLAFIMFFEEDDAESLLKLIDYLFWANAVVSFAQFFVLGYNQDNLGGLFGVERGCNAYSLAFFSVVIGKSILSFINRKEKAWLCFLKCGVSLIIAAMAELKFYFVVFVMILIVAAVITKFSKRKLILILISSFLFMAASTFMTAVFGEGSSLDIERIWELMTATSYATEKDLGRFAAIPTIARTFLTEVHELLFGMGLGNCDTSAFAICNTPFYQTYAYLHYTWFSSAFLFLETGCVGLMAYLIFYAMCFFGAWKQLKSNAKKDLFCQLSMIISIVCVILTFYNSSLRMEVAYLLFFALSLPFLRTAEGGNITEKNVSNKSFYQ